MKLMQKIAQKEEENEQTYKNYFKKVDEKLKVRKDIHEAAVYSVEKKKKQKFEEWEKQREADYAQKQKQREEKEIHLKEKANHDTVETLKRQVEEKEREREEFKKSYFNRVQEVKGEIQQSIEKKALLQNKYREYLEQQIQNSPKAAGRPSDKLVDPSSYKDARNTSVRISIILY